VAGALNLIRETCLERPLTGVWGVVCVCVCVRVGGAGELVAGALNLVGETCLYGRNWGCAHGKKYDSLHFEMCYYQVAPSLPILLSLSCQGCSLYLIKV